MVFLSGLCYKLSMKAVSHTLWIIVAAVVILVVALVMLTIFGTGMGQFTNALEAKSWCVTQGKSTCTFGGLPPTWAVNNIKIVNQDQLTSCKAELACDTCTSCEDVTEWGG